MSANNLTDFVLDLAAILAVINGVSLVAFGLWLRWVLRATGHVDRPAVPTLVPALVSALVSAPQFPPATPATPATQVFTHVITDGAGAVRFRGTDTEAAEAIWHQIDRHALPLPHAWHVGGAPYQSRQTRG